MFTQVEWDLKYTKRMFIAVLFTGANIGNHLMSISMRMNTTGPKQRTSDTSNNIDGSHRHSAEWKKSQAKRVNTIGTSLGWSQNRRPGKAKQTSEKWLSEEEEGANEHKGICWGMRKSSILIWVVIIEMYTSAKMYWPAHFTCYTVFYTLTF